MTKEFGRWLRTQMDRREWGVTRMARELDVSHGLVSQWLKGERNPSPASLENISDRLYVDLDMLLTLAGHRDPDLEVDPDSPEAELLPLIRKIDWASDPMRLKGIKVQLEGYLEVDRMRKREVPGDH